MSLHFITTDMARWGAGQERPLTAAELDDVIWTLKLAIDAAAGASAPIISAIRLVSGANMWIDLSDGSTFGPFPLPVAHMAGKGEWAPETSYLPNDLITRGNSGYVVLYGHTSGAVFSEGQTDGSGHLVYSKIFSIADSIPNGGEQGMVLVKKTAMDRDVVWAFQIGLLPAGATAGQILGANSATYADASWKSSITLPAYGEIDVSGAVTLDFANGECQRLNVVGDVASLAIDNFGVAGRTFKLTLEIWGADAHTVAWPAGWLWEAGTLPVLGAKAIIVLVTLDGGATIYANILGQNFKIAGP